MNGNQKIKRNIKASKKVSKKEKNDGQQKRGNSMTF